jgi:hypothetical protein
MSSVVFILRIGVEVIRWAMEHLRGYGIRRVDSRSNPPSLPQRRVTIMNGYIGAAKWWIVASLRIHPTEFNYTFNPLCYSPSRGGLHRKHANLAAINCQAFKTPRQFRRQVIPLRLWLCERDFDNSALK